MANIREDGARPRWQKNLYVLFLAELLSLTGVTAVMPFLSLYVDELGVSVGNTELWVGMVVSAHSLTMAAIAPVWGALADRFGRKVMVQRALLGGVVTLNLMALVQSVEQLVLLRAMQGIVMGTVAAASTLVAASTPRQRLGHAIGLMQMGVWTGASIGPLLGGVIVDTFGFRTAFHLSSLCLLLAGIGVTLFVQEEFVATTRGRFSGSKMLRNWLDILRMPRMPRLLSMRLLARSGWITLRPFMPLFVGTLMASQDRVSAVSGLVIGISSAFSALGSVTLGRVGDRIGHRQLLLFCSLGAAVGYLSMALVTQVWQLAILYAITGGLMGGVISLMGALMAQAAPGGQMGSVYGLDTSVTSIGRMVLPLLLAALIAFMGMRSMFLPAALGIILVALLAASRQSTHPQSAPTGGIS